MKHGRMSPARAGARTDVPRRSETLTEAAAVIRDEKGPFTCLTEAAALIDIHFPKNGPFDAK